MASFLVGPISSAFAEEGVPKADGKCPADTVEVAGLTDCFTKTAEMQLCPGTTEIYYVGTGDTCPSAGASDKSGESITAQEALQKFMAIILSIEQMLNKLLWPILFLIGGLLDNNILFGSGMEDRLYSIWVPIRNIVNIIFVIALVGLALYSVLGINSENSQFSIKTMLPKLIVGIIAVNFSFIAIKVCLDAVNVFTTSIFAIPSQIMEVKGPVLGSTPTAGGAATPDLANQRKVNAFCKQVYSLLVTDGKVTKFDESIKDAAIIQLGRDYNIFATKPADIEALATIKFKGAEKTKWDDDVDALQGLALCAPNPNDTLKLSPAGESFFKQYGSSNAALAMAINMGEIMFYKDMPGSMGSGTFESLAVNVIFSVLLYVVYAISFVVLFIVLLARLVVLWLGLALSPLIALSMVLPIAKEKFKLGELTDKFVAHAIAPIPIALVMTIGWIMLNAIKSTMTATGSVMGTKGVLIPALPIPGLETLQGLLISLATVAVVWIGVFMAADGTIAAAITSGIKGQAQKFGSFLATAPIKFTPWVPVETKEGGGEKVTPDALMHIVEQLPYKMAQKGREKAAKIFGMEGMTGSISDVYSGTTPDQLVDVLKKPKSEVDLTKAENQKKIMEATKAIAGLRNGETNEEKKLGEMLAANLADPTLWKNESRNNEIRQLAERIAKANEKAKKEGTTPTTPTKPGEPPKPGKQAAPAKLPATVEDAVKSKDKGFNEYLVATGKGEATETDLADPTKKAELKAAFTAYQAVRAAATKGEPGSDEKSLVQQGLKAIKTKFTDSTKWLREKRETPEAPPEEPKPADKPPAD